MKKRLPTETLSEYAIRMAWEYGHFWSPDNPEGLNVSYSDLQNLKPTDDVVVRALLSLSKMDMRRFTESSIQTGNILPDFNGELSPAMAHYIHKGRCPIPDYAPPVGVSFAFSDPDLQHVVEQMQQDLTLPAIGSGNWKGCNSVGDFHCAIIKVDSSAMPTFLFSNGIFVSVIKRVQIAYAKMGLLLYFVDNTGNDIITNKKVDGRVNINFSFVGSSDGWIGLAIVGNGQTCSSNIWCKYLNTYRGGDDTESIITQWTTLIKHELGHNCGRGHTNGGVMNPSIVNNLPADWTNSDPSYTWLRQQFGGVPVPIPGSNPPPTPNPNPDQSLQEQIDSLRIKNVVQDAMLEYLIKKVNNL